MTAVDQAPIYCRFYLDDGETCRGGLYIEEHALTAQGWLHPTVFNPRTGRPVWPEGVNG